MVAVPETFFEFGDFRVDPRKRLLTRRGGQVIALTPKHFDTLLYLVENAGVVLEKDRIMGAVWPRMVVEENNLNQAVSQLRRLLGDDGAEHRYILTVPRRGYRFVADVHVAAPGGPGPDEASVQPPAHRWRLGVAAALVALAGVAVLAWKVSSGPSTGIPAVDKSALDVTPAEKSIAVLPFTNFSGAREDEFFSDGITEDMVTQLAQISGLKVISRASILEYKDSKKPLRQIARELGVAHILQGSVRRDDKSFRINAQLIDPAHEGHLWAKSYDRDIKDVLEVQSEVATEIAAALKTRLLGPERDQLDKRARGNPETYILYRKGRHLLGSWGNTTLQGRQAARGYFEQVALLDPASPLGYAGQAEYYFRAAMKRDEDPVKAFARALEFAERARTADDASAEAHLALAAIHAHGYWDWHRAETHAKRAVDLSPGNGEAWALYGGLLASLGRLEEALVAKQRAMSLDPINPQVAQELVFTLLDQGRCDLATKQARFNLEADAANIFYPVVFARCHEIAGEFREAIATYGRMHRPWMPKEAVAALSSAVDKATATGSSQSAVAAAYWRTRLEWQKKVAPGLENQNYFVAAVASQAGERDEAFRYLHRSIDRREIHLHGLKADYQFKAIRDDPRFAAALKRLNLS
jgi:TolB-like protein/DNA-binding winged helix-turn-helix (wHTH) protein/Flp pilus assembly protein TadD